MAENFPAESEIHQIDTISIFSSKLEAESSSSDDDDDDVSELSAATLDVGWTMAYWSRFYETVSAEIYG
jgi:hypothetical protein